MTYWPGTKIPKSNGNAFTYWKNGDQSIITKDKSFKFSVAASLGGKVTQTTEKSAFKNFSINPKK